MTPAKPAVSGEVQVRSVSGRQALQPRREGLSLVRRDATAGAAYNEGGMRSPARVGVGRTL